MDRPSIDQFVGNQNIVELLRLSLDRSRGNKPLDHVLLSGPPGTGKTTLARIIHEEIAEHIHDTEVHLHYTSGPQLSNVEIVNTLIMGMRDTDVLFIDEIHRIPPKIEEVLYPVLEDGQLDISFGRKLKMSTRVEVAPITIIGATTKLASLSKPLRDRFPLQFRLETYTDHEIRQVLVNRATQVRATLKQEGLDGLVGASRGVPRVALTLLERAMDVVGPKLLEKQMVIDEDVVQTTLRLMGINKHGFTNTEIAMLQVLASRDYPMSLDSLASFLDESAATIEETYEPFMIRRGYISRGPRGRSITREGKQYIEDEENRND